MIVSSSQQGARQIVAGVDTDSVDFEGQMQMHAFRTSGIAHLADDLASGDSLSFGDIRRSVQMHVHRSHAVLMVDDDIVAHVVTVTCLIDDAAVDRIDRRITHISVGEVRSGMSGIAAKTAADPRIVHRPDIVSGTDHPDLLGTDGDHAALGLLDDRFRKQFTGFQDTVDPLFFV